MSNPKTLSRAALYAAGLPLGECVTQRRPDGRYLCGGGGGGGSSSSSNTTTQNYDQRQAIQDGIGVTASDGNTVNYNSTDAVKAIAQLSTDAITSMGGAVVDLTESTTAANALAWDKTVSQGAKLIDKLIDKSTEVGAKAVESFQPAENKANDTSLKLGMIAAAGVAATLLLSKMK